MLKDYQKTFSLLQKFLDISAISFCWIFAYWLRFNLIAGAQQGIAKTFLALLPFLWVLTSYFYHKNGLYRPIRFSSRYLELFAVFKANTQIILGLVIGIYFLAPERLSRLMLLSFFITSQLTMAMIRIMVRNYLRHVRKKGRNLRQIILVGTGNQVLDYLQTIKKFKDAGIRIVGWLDSNGLAQANNIPDSELTPIEFAKQTAANSIVFGYRSEDSLKLKETLKDFSNDVFDIQVLPEISTNMIGNEIENFEGLPIIHVNRPNLSSFDILIKRIFDFLASFIGVIFIGPLLILISIFVKLSSSGPIFFGQVRLGLDGKNFTMWKFRTMRVDLDNESNTEWSNKENPRKTKFGDFLRKTSLDELPQLYNVIKGDMSLVGPRPERPFFVDKFRSEIPNYMLRHKLPPGITGWAQVNGWRGDTSIEKRINCDIFYIKHWTFWFDIKIILLTFLKGFFNKNAY